MSNCILLGKPNVGKTSFFLNFAEYLGMNSCILEFTDFEGKKSVKKYSIKAAKSYLISSTAFKTKEVCKMKLSIPIYKGKTDIVLLDTGGLIDGINKDESIRISMAETLKHLYIANIIIHMIDASSIYKKQTSTISEIDYQINQYGNSKGAYCILANKIDLREGLEGLEFLKKEFKDTYIIPTSALKQIGFKEVRKFVSRNIE
ncbi:small GTP-binding protein domain-containing protein [Anaerovirgula multivorans]|uniref:Small GTP-binding protein domain-containing protein n=1 Tax=Anaerovirgula multivorans TaxID=312168 RepID=A0A238ZXE5_9FIRM|nr:GTP-binding protein [Anaerovirgula multivorans]SNR87990.1 small GTP-binding protein domain-containing protein [Anaerovirgula multivorans]